MTPLDNIKESVQKKTYLTDLQELLEALVKDCEDPYLPENKRNRLNTYKDQLVWVMVEMDELMEEWLAEAIDLDNQRKKSLAVARANNLKRLPITREFDGSKLPPLLKKTEDLICEIMKYMEKEIEPED